MPLAPVARTCHECGPGEQALWTEVQLTGPGGCGDALRAELAGAAIATLPARLATLPSGCAVLRVDVPRGLRYLGFRYEAALPGGRSSDCFPDRPCGAGACRFAGEPILLREGSDTTVLAFFEVESAEPRSGGLTVYYSSARRRP